MNNYFDYFNYPNGYNNAYVKKSANNHNTSEKIDPYKGFLRGNLFDNLYVPYMNYKPIEVNPANEKEYDMFMVQMYSFAAHDLNLYLDVNPNDDEAIKLREKYFNMYIEAKMKYENKYGPIDISSDLLNSSPWMWNTKKWPWEGNK